ncbi:MAG TPA: hypothetical protein VHD60_00380 [Candidatus Saccharimonadales bacterium]|nr:hypothetical protein [Candidatus Saccharimonadales bacterium]
MSHIAFRLNKLFSALAVTVLLIFAAPATAMADVLNPTNPTSTSNGIEGTIPGPAPTQAASIGTPANGQTFTNIPITVSGLCPKGLLVKVFSNNIFVGSAQCTSGSFSVQADLFSGRNDLVARVYDALDQSGPDSNVVTVTFNDAQFLQYGTRVSLTSAYAKRGADPGKELDWPITLSGGVGPYALSADWGDGSGTELLSATSTGTITIKHTYTNAGVYKVVVKATDKNGTTAFLQLVGIGNGQASGAASGSSGGGTVVTTKTNVLWWPALVMLPVTILAFWLGGRHELFSIRRQLDKSRSEIQ